MKKYIPIITLIILLIVFGYLVVGKKSISPQTKILDQGNKNDTQNKTINKYNLPIAPESPNVSNVLIHYFFTGTLKELKKAADGTEIILADADPNLPDIIVTNTTRVQKISPPYESNATPINVNTLKPGQRIDISAEFDLKTGAWFVLDVFFATDRN